MTALSHWDVSYELADLPDRPTFLDAACALINRLLPGDDVFYVDSDFAAGTSEVWHGPHTTHDPDLGTLLAQAVDRGPDRRPRIAGRGLLR